MRRWAASVALLVAVVAFGGGMALAQGQPAVQVHKVEGHFAPSPGGTVFVLAIGIDGRPGIDTDRADAIHVIGFNPALGAATILDIPRDTWVPIPGRGSSKVNDAYTYGGPDLQAKVVGKLVGVDIRYVVTATFAGFPKLVDEIGGLTITVDVPMHDRFAGANFDPGVRHMNGGETFAFTRSRHIPDGDLRRTLNQGHVIQAAHAKLRGQGVSAGNVVRWLGILGRNTKITGGATVVDLYRLGRQALAIEPARIRNVVMPARLGMVGAASVVFADPAAGRLFADFRDDAVLQAH